MGVPQERFGGNAAAQQAGTAESRILFDDGGSQTQLTGSDRSDVAAGAGSDNRDIKRRLLFHGITPAKFILAAD